MVLRCGPAGPAASRKCGYTTRVPVCTALRPCDCGGLGMQSGRVRLCGRRGSLCGCGTVCRCLCVAVCPGGREAAQGCRQVCACDGVGLCVSSGGFVALRLCEIVTVICEGVCCHVCLCVCVGRGRLGVVGSAEIIQGAKRACSAPDSPWACTLWPGVLPSTPLWGQFLA